MGLYQQAFCGVTLSFLPPSLPPSLPPFLGVCCFWFFCGGGRATGLARSYFPDQGLNPGPLQ